MEGLRRTCNSCGCDCHCYSPDCPKCPNDVCTKCECGNQEDIPSSFTKRN